MYLINTDEKMPKNPEKPRKTPKNPEKPRKTPKNFNTKNVTIIAVK
jgi:hypothetical protein